MNHDTILHMLLLAVPMVLAGFGLGLAYFRLLRLTVHALTAAAGWQRPLVFSLARIGGAVLLFGLATRFGALALLAAFAGFLLARAVALRDTRRAA